MQIDRYVIQATNPFSAVQEMPASLMSRCLVALLSVGRVDGLE